MNFQNARRMIKRNLEKKIIFVEDAVATTIKNLPTGKASVSNDIPVFIIKETIDVYSQKITQIMNDCLKNNFFPDILKNAEITPCFKKEDKGGAGGEKYRPASILPNFSKAFERII